MAPRAFEAAEPALDALRRESPDVLITDIRMPGPDGWSLARHARALRPDMPVIYTTGDSAVDWPAHPIFGPMTLRAWMRWGYLHVDHHLRQFSA